MSLVALAAITVSLCIMHPQPAHSAPKVTGRNISNAIAEEFAFDQAVRGVRSVINNIGVDPCWERSGREIENDAGKALLHHPAAGSSKLLSCVKRPPASQAAGGDGRLWQL
ncbi:MAG: hypothetical protein R6U43_06545 [Candidatus Krumholzibacteriales bacterium]